MEHSKLVLLFVLFMAAGVTFMATGLYFMSEKYLKNINGSKTMGKITGVLSCGLGVLTIFTGLLLFTVPAAFEYTVVAYLAILFIAACAVMIYFKSKK
ncbi:MAG: hypothetical protein WCR31_08370 [Treponema sp.]